MSKEHDEQSSLLAFCLDIGFLRHSNICSRPDLLQRKAEDAIFAANPSSTKPSVGLTRGVSEGLGPVGGAAWIYSASALIMLPFFGLPRLSTFPRSYLYIGSALFVLYGVFFSLSLGFATNATQAIEVGMVNYLWPGLTILLTVLFTRQKANILIVPGLVLSFVGVCWVLGGGEGLHLDEMLFNVRGNPLSYSFAFLAAVTWAGYCTVTVKLSQQKNGVSLFLMLTALVLWVIFFQSTAPAMQVDLKIAIYLLASGFAVGLGYAAWNVGILYGNITVLAAISYFTPILASAFAALLLRAPLTLTFWQGALMVSLGSLICWISTK